MTPMHVVIAAYYIGLAVGTAKQPVPMDVAKWHARQEGWSTDDDTWLNALDIVNARRALRGSEQP